MVGNNKYLQESAKLARDLFRRDPTLAIDTAARIINETCRRGLAKPVLSDIRRDVRGASSPLPVQQQEVPVMIAETQHVKPKHVKPKPASAEVRATHGERKQFLESWALENPTATIAQARQALRSRFDDIAMGTQIISDTLRMSRALWEDQRKEAIAHKVIAPQSVNLLGGHPIRPTTVQHGLIELLLTCARCIATLPDMDTKTPAKISLARVLGSLTEAEAQAVWSALGLWVDNETTRNDTEDDEQLAPIVLTVGAVVDRMNTEIARLAE